MSESLVVGVLWPAEFDRDAFAQLMSTSPRPVEVHLDHYQEDAALRILRAQRANSELIIAKAPPISATMASWIRRAEVILALDPPVNLLGLAPQLRWIQAAGAGVGQFDHRGLAEHGVRLTTAAGVGAPAIAEFVLCRLLEVWKEIRSIEDSQRMRAWRPARTRTLAGCTLGVVGMGAIGTAVAVRAQAFGMRVLGIRRRYVAGMVAPNADELYGPSELPHVLGASDAVVLAAPETAETSGLIGPQQLAMMKPGAVLCNVARGSLLDEAALIQALQSGHLAAAILDVTRQEPLPARSPLWNIPNLYLSPHCATAQDKYPRRLLELFAANVLRYIDGKSLRNEVDLMATAEAARAEE